MVKIQFLRNTGFILFIYVYCINNFYDSSFDSLFHWKALIMRNKQHNPFNRKSISYLQQKEKEELKAICQAYNSDTRFEYYSEAQRN